MSADIVAPCGMNCALCANHQALVQDVRKKGLRMPYCPGCRPRGKNCAFLKKRCDALQTGSVRFCHECGNFPCPSLQALDRRYRDHFHTSFIENLELIRDKGMRRLLARDRKRWACPRCGGIVSCHNGLCFRCDFETLKTKKTRYRWAGDE